MQTLKIDKIIPDPNQPRRYFDATKMRTLRGSIQKHGIRQPLIVEDLGDGTYLLEDGERRYRAATELGLKEVPVIIEKKRSEIDRLVEQFNIQEQHEAWSPIEKANAIVTIAEKIERPLNEVCDLLGVPERTAKTYIAFANLSQKTLFEKNEVPMSWAQGIQGLKSFLRRHFTGHLEKEFTKTMEADTERAIISQIKNGDLNKLGELNRLKDAVRKDPAALEWFFDGKTVTEVFVKAKAKGAYHLRQAKSSAHYLGGHIQAFMNNADVEVSEDVIKELKYARKFIDQLLHKVDVTE